MRIKRAALNAYLLFRLPVIWLAAVLGALFIHNGAWNPSVQGRRKILFIRLDRLGDLVLTLPVIDNMRQAHPDAEISLLVRPYLAGLARLIKPVDNVIVYRGFFSTARALRRAGFTIAVDMLNDYSLKPALLALVSGAPVRAGFPGGYRELLFTHRARIGTDTRHMAAVNLEILKALGVPVAAALPRLRLDGPAKGPDVVVAIHPGGHYPSQRWGAERFASVAAKIAGAYNVRLLVLGGPGDRDAVEKISASVRGASAGGVSVEPVLKDLEGLARALASASLLICNNSGPLHLAAALGVPTVSTMGPTDPALWWPQGPDQIVIRKELPCSPCGAGRCDGHECMDAITVEEVFAKAAGILDRIDGIARR